MFKFKDISDKTIDVGDLIKTDNKILIAKKTDKLCCKGCIFYTKKYLSFNIKNLCNCKTIYCQANRSALHHRNCKYYLIFDIFTGV